MNDLDVRTQQLPDTLEDLTQFVLVSKAKLQAYMLKLQTVNKLSVAQEIRDQTLQEAQEVSTALIAAEQRIGELLLSIPKASGNQYTSANSTQTEKAKTKTETIKDMGYTKDEASDYQQMAKHPEVVKQVLADAEANGEIATKASVMREIKFYKDRVKAQQEELDALRNKGSEVRTVEKIVEVVPADYEELKQSREASKKEYESLRKEYDRMADKWKESERQRTAIIKTMNAPEEKRKTDLKNDCFFFCAGVKNFLEKYGGYVYLKDELDLLPEREQKAYMDSVRAMRDWVETMLGEITIGG